MTLGSFRTVRDFWAAALIVSLGWGSASAGDEIVVPPSLSGTPGSFSAFTAPAGVAVPPVVAIPQPLVASGGTCATCNNKGRFLSCRPCNSKMTSLNPDACFGFYHTQWSRWEDICPIPTPGSVIQSIPVSPPNGAVVTGKPIPQTNAKGTVVPPPRPAPLPSIPKPLK